MAKCDFCKSELVWIGSLSSGHLGCPLCETEFPQEVEDILTRAGDLKREEEVSGLTWDEYPRPQSAGASQNDTCN